MEIGKKRIRKLQAHLPASLEGVCVVPAIPMTGITGAQLQRIGFNGMPQVGESILPAVVGPVTRFNAEGKDIIHRDQPMETCYRQVMWTRLEWHGKERIEVTEITDVPYQRYPRTHVPPPGVEFTVAEQNGSLLLVTEATSVDFAQPDKLLHMINVCLEAFGRCQVLRQDLSPVTVTPTIHLNWTVLPVGKMPWKTLKPRLSDLIEGQKPGNRPVIEYRLEKVNTYGPEFVAVGRGGFAGYVIFGFPRKNLFVLECTRYGNATYVFDRDWQDLSKLTKAEILDGNLQRERFIHVTQWGDRIHRLLS